MNCNQWFWIPVGSRSFRIYLWVWNVIVTVHLFWCFSDMYFDNNFCAMVHLLFVVYRCEYGCSVLCRQLRAAVIQFFLWFWLFLVRDQMMLFLFSLTCMHAFDLFSRAVEVMVMVARGKDAEEEKSKCNLLLWNFLCNYYGIKSEEQTPFTSFWLSENVHLFLLFRFVFLVTSSKASQLEENKHKQLHVSAHNCAGMQREITC